MPLNKETKPIQDNKNVNFEELEKISSYTNKTKNAFVVNRTLLSKLTSKQI